MREDGGAVNDEHEPIAVMSENPYRAPVLEELRDLTPAPVPDVDLASAEDVRKSLIGHESLVRSLSWFFFLAAAAIAWAGIATLITGLAGNSGFLPRLGVLLIIGSLAAIVVGVGLRRLRRWARLIAGVVAGLGIGLMLVVPTLFVVSTPLGIYLIYLLFSAKGEQVFSGEYRQIIEATPEIRWRTTVFTWILLGIVAFIVLSSGATLMLDVVRAATAP